eukprot:IDg3841t1
MEVLMKKLEDQEQVIESMRDAMPTSGSGSRAPRVRSTPSARPPTIPFYSGEGKECTSAKVKSFMYNVKKAGEFSEYDEPRTLALAECYLTDAAAVWLEKLEQEGKKPIQSTTFVRPSFASLYPRMRKHVPKSNSWILK